MKRIGVIAMSGVRAHNPELTKLGLTLPGFVEHNKIIASLPSLGLLTLAGLTPDTFEVEYREIADLRQDEQLPEEARALRGRFGKSDLLSITVGGGTQPAQCLTGLRSFSLQAGLPQFTVGIVKFVERQPPDTIVWAVTGQAGFRYLIEKAGKDFIWQTLCCRHQCLRHRHLH
ncbi:MAG TPA: hypothetical protein VN578_11900 [Candidatus Binatia bacterium]|jgi:hypothetical protein|nr:hypothetical protein [Candidatus Binatia bacterium]